VQPVSPILPNHVGLAAVTTGLKNTMYAEHQAQYKRLPALVAMAQPGRATTRWQLTWRERWKVLLTGELWIQGLTFCRPLMPLKPMVDEPSVEECL
jgi:hypothetical protein